MIIPLLPSYFQTDLLIFFLRQRVHLQLLFQPLVLISDLHQCIQDWSVILPKQYTSVVLFPELFVVRAEVARESFDSPGTIDWVGNWSECGNAFVKAWIFEGAGKRAVSTLTRWTSVFRMHAALDYTKTYHAVPRNGDAGRVDGEVFVDEFWKLICYV